MLKRLKHVQICVSMSFRHEISSTCKRKMPQIDPELSKKLNFFDAFSVQFSKNFALRSSTINSTTKTSFALHFLKKTLQRFASKTLQNDSKGVEKIQQPRFRATCALFESFGSQNVIKRSTKTELIIQ